MTDLASLPDVITADEFAALLRCTPRHVTRLARTRGTVAGVPPISGIGRRILFSKQLVAEALAGGRVSA